MESLKTKRIMFRLTDKELSFLKKKSKNYGSVSEYLRMILNEKMPVNQNKKVQTALLNMNYYLNKIGTNINQIAKNNNSKLYREEDKKILHRSMQEIKSEFIKLKKQIEEISDGNSQDDEYKRVKDR